MSDRQTVNGNGTIKPGEEVWISPDALASALKGQVWGVPDGTGVEYDGEFIGEHYEGCMLVRIKRKSEAQPKKTS